MIEAMLRGLTELKGVRAVVLVEDDGFVVHSYPTPHALEPSTVEAWLHLVSETPKDALTTVVTEGGYVMFTFIERRILITVCERSSNLGKVRSVLGDINPP